MHSQTLTSPTGEVMGQKGISWHQTLFPWGKGGAGKVKLFLLLCVQSWIFALMMCWNFSAGLLYFHKSLSFMGDCAISVLQRLPDRGLRGDGASSRRTLGSTARTKVCKPIAWRTGKWESSWVSWHMVLVREPKANGVLISYQGFGIISELATWVWLKWLFSKWLSFFLHWTGVS